MTAIHFLVALVLVAATVDGGSSTLPNFVVLLMDDMGWGDLGCFGEPSHETPHLDQMALEGMLVPAMYAAAPLCSPSRASLLTGRLPIRNGFYTSTEPGRNAYTPQEIVGGITDWELLLPELLKQKNYTTGLVGKWHLGHRDQYLPLRHGFDSHFGSTNCHFGPYDDVTTPNIPVFRDDKMVGRYYEDYQISNHLSNYTRQLTEEAVSFIAAQEESDDPFLLVWTPDSSHAPTYASEGYIGRSMRGSYGSSVQELDAGVGAILSQLQLSGLANSTLVVFSSDNGAALVSKFEGGSNGPLLCGKQTTFDGGMRVPGIFWWPGTITPGTVTQQVWSHMDLLPTFLQLAGIPAPSDRILDGLPMANSLLHPEMHTARAVFLYRGDRLMAVRRGAYKMHLWTWNTSEDELSNGIDYCPGQRQPNVTTSTAVDHTQQPLLYRIIADPAERYLIPITSAEYQRVVPMLQQAVQQHEADMEPGEPQLDWCDRAVMHWSPPGCEELGRCLDGPPSAPYLCPWPH